MPAAARGSVGSTLAAADASGVAVCASASLLQGRLTRGMPAILSEAFGGFDSDAQRALQFVRSTPGINVALAGMSSAAHVTHNLVTARQPPASFEALMSSSSMHIDGDRVAAGSVARRKNRREAETRRRPRGEAGKFDEAAVPRLSMEARTRPARAIGLWCCRRGPRPHGRESQLSTNNYTIRSIDGAHTIGHAHFGVTDGPDGLTTVRGGIAFSTATTTSTNPRCATAWTASCRGSCASSIRSFLPAERPIARAALTSRPGPGSARFTSTGSRRSAANSSTFPTTSSPATS